MEPGHWSPGHLVSNSGLVGSGQWSVCRVNGQCVRPGVWAGFEF